ncbi:MAG TPA: GHKL domain-containing protein [Clostridia bacterium]|nr:GHKL domain-containing protein [Clostridia bacterium]
MNLLVANFLRALVSTTMNVVLMLSLLQPKYGKCVTNLAMLGVLLADLSVAIFCYLSGNLTMLAKLDSILFIVLCFAVKPLFKDTFMQWLFSYITIQNISVMVIVLSFVGSRHMPCPPYANVILRLVLFLAIFFVLKRYVRPLYHQIVERWSVFFYVALAIWVTFTYYVLCSDDIVRTLTDQAVPLLLVIAISVASYISICHSLATLSREHALREGALQAEARQEMLRAELSSYNEYVMIARQNRHDLRHHNALLMEYLVAGDVDGAKEYLKQYDESIKETALTSYCKNPIANAILRLYESRTGRAGIIFTVNTDIPERLPLNAPETGVLFSNLLENACEACEKVDDGNRVLLVVAETDEYRLKLEIGNTVAVAVGFNENGMPFSTKEGGGTGTKSVAAIVKKHGGMLRFACEKEMFMAQVVLPLTEMKVAQKLYREESCAN